MAEDKPAAKKKEEAPPPAVLGSAAASADPVVQDLLARREIAVLNGDKHAIEAVNAQLAELGVG